MVPGPGLYKPKRRRKPKNSGPNPCKPNSQFFPTPDTDDTDLLLTCLPSQVVPTEYPSRTPPTPPSPEPETDPHVPYGDDPVKVLPERPVSRTRRHYERRSPTPTQKNSRGSLVIRYRNWIAPVVIKGSVVDVGVRHQSRHGISHGRPIGTPEVEESPTKTSLDTRSHRRDVSTVPPVPSCLGLYVGRVSHPLVSGASRRLRRLFGVCSPVGPLDSRGTFLSWRPLTPTSGGAHPSPVGRNYPSDLPGPAVRPWDRGSLVHDPPRPGWGPRLIPSTPSGPTPGERDPPTWTPGIVLTPKPLPRVETTTGVLCPDQEVGRHKNVLSGSRTRHLLLHLGGGGTHGPPDLSGSSPPPPRLSSRALFPTCRLDEVPLHTEVSLRASTESVSLQLVTGIRVRRPPSTGPGGPAREVPRRGIRRGPPGPGSTRAGVTTRSAYPNPTPHPVPTQDTPTLLGSLLRRPTAPVFGALPVSPSLVKRSQTHLGPVEVSDPRHQQWVSWMVPPTRPIPSPPVVPRHSPTLLSPRGRTHPGSQTDLPIHPSEVDPPTLTRDGSRPRVPWVKVGTHHPRRHTSEGPRGHQDGTSIPHSDSGLTGLVFPSTCRLQTARSGLPRGTK